MKYEILNDQLVPKRGKESEHVPDATIHFSECIKSIEYHSYKIIVSSD